MIRANLKKNIVELSGNEADHLNELMMLVWEMKEKYPEQREMMKEAINVFMDATECPVFEDEDKKPAPLDEEDIEYLFCKIKEAKCNGKAISYDCFTTGKNTVWIWYKDTEGKHRAETTFEFYLHATAGYKAEASREEYDRCIKYLEQLASEAGH
ncbi:hypothetical protein DW833_03825 [Anaerobutyricum hallii]|uniref:Uncharacterized protein n=1 Tax=Anaerobutyricum hallii TaxID=39488 RepID=A0A414B874_9FIRM|nr:hypothetical protein [Anaerobutyricum hallii]RHC66977.1 hypothetical protein DW833_03825 [Anaerobutyricum hallii]